MALMAPLELTAVPRCALLLLLLPLPRVRPHGFASVGKVEADSALGQLLLHGCQLLLELSFRPGMAFELNQRLAE